MLNVSISLAAPEKKVIVFRTSFKKVSREKWHFKYCYFIFYLLYTHHAFLNIQRFQLRPKADNAESVYNV